MIPSSKVLWGEGLFLRPQHFQRQDAYHEWRLHETSKALHPYAWGVRKVNIDTDALASGVLRFNELQLVMPDGELFRAPQEDDLPDPVNLSDIPAGVAEIVFHAAMAPMRGSATNFTPLGQAGDGALRFAQHNQPATDWYTNAAAADVAVLRRLVRLLPDTAPRDHLVSLPVCRLRRSGTGSFEVDSRFLAPAVSIEASPILRAILRRLLDTLQAKVDALYGFHREPSKHVIEFRSGDIASFWLLHTASSAFGALSHYHHQAGLHPERLYERLLELAGALMTFSRSFTLADLPAYQHADPGPGFAKLDHIIRELLETVISTRYFALALDEVRPSYHHARLESEKITPATRLYLGVQAAMQPSDLVEAVPVRFKVGAPDDVEKLVLSAMSGVQITHSPQVPAAIPVRSGAYYFAIEPRGPLYERMLQSQTLALYAPAGIDELRLELFALNG